MKKVMILLGIGLVICCMLAGCKKKSEEEKVGELLGKAAEAKSEREAKKIEGKIEKLTQKQRREEKKSNKEITIELGQPFTFGQWDNWGEKVETRFTVTFDSLENNWLALMRRSMGKILKFTFENLGPLGNPTSPTFGELELKTDKGYTYRGKQSVILSGNIPKGKVREVRVGYGELIFPEVPDGATAVEVTGIAGKSGFGGKYDVKFHLKLTRPRGEAAIEDIEQTVSETTGTIESALKPEPLNFPLSVPPTGGKPDPDVLNIIAEAKHTITSGTEDVIALRDKLNKALTMPISSDQQAFIKEQLSNLADKWLFSATVYEGDTYCTKYEIEVGDSLSSIAKTYKIPYEILMDINPIRRPDTVRPGTVIKVVKGPFHAIVYRSTFTLDLYLQDTFIKSFPVGLGQPGNETPLGLWVVKPFGKLIKPTWTDPDTSRTYQYGHPNNPLGSRWIGLEGVEGEAKGRSGFGIHGSKDTSQVSMPSTRGSICLRDEYVILLYNVLMPEWSYVKVVQ